MSSCATTPRPYPRALSMSDCCMRVSGGTSTGTGRHESPGAVEHPSNAHSAKPCASYFPVVSCAGRPGPRATRKLHQDTETAYLPATLVEPDTRPNVIAVDTWLGLNMTWPTGIGAPQRCRGGRIRQRPKEGPLKLHWVCKPAVAAAVMGMAALSGCSTANPVPGAGPPTTTPPLTSTNSSSPVTTAASSTAPTPTDGAPTGRAPSSSQGCAPTPNGRPTGEVTGASVKQIIDVDGDGRPDTGWIGGSGLFGITTASGATFSTVIKSPGPNPRSMLVADVDGQGTIVALASDQRGAALLLVKNCALVPAQNAQGSTYYFDLGYGVSGTGVGCSQVAGTQGRGLVGLKLIRDNARNPQSVERTQIIIDGTQARNGAHDTVSATGPQGAAAAASATQISCGDLTMATDGVHGG